MTGWHFFEDHPAREAVLNMAIDECLLTHSSGPALRSYHWDSAAVSIGYFSSIAEARALFPGRTIVRRWTGGGMVDHASDATFSVVVPGVLDAPHPHGAKHWYCRIHSALADALQELTEAPVVLMHGRNRGGTACFEHAVENDGLIGTTKIFGGAIRKTRAGILYQGSLQNLRAPEGLFALVCRKLAGGFVAPAPLPHSILQAACSLAVDRYAADAWLNRV